MIGARHDGLAAMGFDGRRDLRRVGGDRDTADLRGLRTAQDMDDHRQAGNIQHRLSRQARGGHAGGNQHQSAGFGHWMSKVLTRLPTSRK